MKHPAGGQAAFSPEINDRLERFVHLLTQWTARINLVSQHDVTAVWDRHILDSAQLADLLPDAPNEMIDIGSGAGFPGMVLAIATAWHVHLVEADQRKATFLREAIRATGANAVVHAIRAERLTIAPVPVVTARAVAALPNLLALATPHLRADGICLFPKGRAVADELTAASREWHMRVERFPSRTESCASLLRISEIRRAGPSS